MLPTVSYQRLPLETSHEIVRVVLGVVYNIIKMPSAWTTHLSFQEHPFLAFL